MFIIFSFLLLLLGVLIILPRTQGEGVRLERTASIFAKYANYQESFEVIKKYPVFGVGFNNLCIARQKILGNQNIASHACSGSDSGLLFVLATTGAVGFIIFINVVFFIYTNAKKDIYGTLFRVSMLSLSVHSIFVHSMFYPWVMGWMAILLALAV